MRKIAGKTLGNLAVIFVIVCAVLIWMGAKGLFVKDRSAIMGVGGLVWQGQEYVQVSGPHTTGKLIAKTQDGSWDIYEIEEDPSHTFVAVSAFLEHELYVLKSYDIPDSGRLTAVSWNGRKIQDSAFLAMMEQIEAEKTPTSWYETEGIYRQTDWQKMEELYFAYEDCPVATIYKGYMGKVHGQWIITTHIEPHSPDREGYTVSYYLIPEEYASLLEAYFS